LNPLSNDLNVMRQTLLFGGLESIAYNRNRRNADIMFYEFGNCYSFHAENKKEDKILSPYSEQFMLGLWLSGNKITDSWAHPNEKTSVYQLKAYVMNIFVRLGIEPKRIVLSTMNNELYSTAILIETVGKKTIGTFGIVQKKTLKAFDIDAEVFYAELNWDLLMKEVKSVKVKATDISKFPSVKRDLALLVDTGLTFEEIRKVAFASEKKLLKEVFLFDVYEGKNLPEGKKSYAVSFIIQDDTKTLTDKQIEAIMSKIQKNIEALGATLR
ncbi:MAG: phenylalanine--tRNA ligase subunit beta, partial [Bacteroidales bacterium]